jgi:hypothetical protein
VCNGTRRCRCCSRGGGLDCPQGCEWMRSVIVSWCVAFRVRTRNRPNKKTACSHQERRFVIGRGDFCCSGLSTRTSLGFFQASHRGIFSSSSVGTLRLSPQEFLMLEEILARNVAFAIGVCVIQTRVGGAAGSNGRGERLAGCGGRFIGFLIHSAFFEPPASIGWGEE